MERYTIGRWIYCFVSFVIFLNSVKAQNGDCPTQVIRDYPENLNVLNGCKVIKGNLLIFLIKYNVTRQSYDNLTFPELREITGFLLISENHELKSLGKLFPNLTVIRGRRLFLNYALSIYAMEDLQTVGLKSLVAIQRGYVFIHRNPKLCYLKKINWDRLIHSPGYNHIINHTNDECHEKCNGCDHCWSSSLCQRFDDELQKKSNCHPQCLGGCNGTTAKDCVVCREFSDHGICVEKCPPNRLSSNDHARCYTKKECSEMGFFIYEDECVEYCPVGYNYTGNETNECILCKHNCNYTCHAYPIDSLAASEHYKGCRIVNGSLTIRILEQVSIDALENNLSEIREIWGSLKVYETTSLTNMSMFKHLTKITGEPLDRNKFGLTIFGNKNLKKLWNWEDKKTLDLNGTAILMHSNYKLCNREIKMLLNATSMHSRELDEIQYNEDEIGCDPVTIVVNAVVNSHDTATLAWRVNDTGDGDVRIFYTEADYKNVTFDLEEMEDNCKRTIWASEFRRKDEIEQNSTHFSYQLTSLKQNTNYAYFIKSFKEGLGTFAQSKIEIFTTLADIPMPPIVYTQQKSTNSIELAWFRTPDDEFENQKVTHYVVDIFMHRDDQEMLDQRNYCLDPVKPIDMTTELLDYDNCCSVVEFEREELEFTSFVDQKFRCTLDEPFNCDVIHYNTRKKRDATDDDIPEAYKSEYYVRSESIPADKNSTVIDHLEYFTLYFFQFFACNKQGCGPYFFHSDRTAPDKLADKIENVSVSINPSGSSYEYHVRITPPIHPNGAVLLYNIYFRRRSPKVFIGDVKCLSRFHFANMSYHFKKVYSFSDYKISVRIQSLAGPGKATEWMEAHLIQSSLSWDWTLVMFLAIFTVVFGILAWTTRRYKFSNAIEWFRHVRQRTIQPLVEEEDDEEILMNRMDETDLDWDPTDARDFNDDHFI